MLDVAVIVGSARRESVNRKLADAIVRLGRPGLRFRALEIADLPMYNQDLEAELPASVRRLKREIEAADALLFVTPEYNRSIPALLKNAIDWGARPWGTNSWAGKPGAVAGATPGAVGTAAAQQHLRTILSPLEVHLLSQPELYVSLKEGAIDAEGNVLDEGLLRILERFLERFAAWSERFARVAA